MDFTPKSTIQLCTDCQKSPKHFFWYQNAANLLQVRNSIYTYMIVFRCTYEQRIHKTKCKQQVSTYGNEVHTKYRLRKSKMHYFWYQKRTKTDTGLFFSDTISMKTSKLVASSEFLPKKWTLHQKVQFSHEQIAKKVQSTVVGTKMLQICCKCEKAYRMRKMQICCKFEIAYIHI